MMHAPPESDSSNRPREDSRIDSSIRGSMLLILGRVLSIGMNLGTQVLIVRSLSQTEFGVWAWAISVVEIGAVVSACCLDKLFARLGAIYHEQDRRQELGWLTIVVVSVPLLLGLLGTVFTWVLGARFSGGGFEQVNSFLLLSILATLIPLNAVSCSVLVFLSVLKGAKSVFLRKYLVLPIFKLSGAAAAVLMFSGDPYQLAWSLCLATLLGTLIDLGVIFHHVKRLELFKSLDWRKLGGVFRDARQDLFSLMITDLAFLGRGAVVVVVIAAVSTNLETARYRVVFPIVRLIEIVSLNVIVLFTPAAARLWAKQSHAELTTLHARSKTWLFTLTFPAFAVCLCCSSNLVSLLFGADYVEAAPALRILACGFFLQSIFGLSGQLLRVHGQTKPLLYSDLVALIATLLPLPLLARDFGSVGAAVSVTLGMAVQSLMRHVALKRHCSSRMRMPAEFRFRSAAAVALLITILAILWEFNVFAGTAMAVVSSGLVLRIFWRDLDLMGTFPELRKFASFKLSLKRASQT